MFHQDCILPWLSKVIFFFHIYDPYYPACTFFLKLFMKYPTVYEGCIHLHEQGWKKRYITVLLQKCTASHVETILSPNWSCDKIFNNIDQVRSDWIGKYLVLAVMVHRSHWLLSPYAMTSSHMFSHPALPLSQYVRLF